MYDALPAAVRRRDPLLGACQELAEQNARFPVSGEALRDWVAPVLGRSDREGERLRLAACMLGDIAWSEHPDYRAEIGFLRVLRMPLTGIDHPGRAFMALAVFTRYSGVADSEVTRSAWQLLDEARLSDAFRLGLALRLAFTLSGGTTQVLRRARLRLSGGSLQLVLPRASLTLAAEAVERRLAALANALDRKHAVKAA